MKIYQDNYPENLSKAIYEYGDNTYPIVEYGEIDEGYGYLYTNTSLCLGLEKHYRFLNEELIAIHLDNHFTLTINNQIVNSKYILYILLFFYHHEIDINVELDEYRQILYYSYLILDDIVNDNYEDIVLTTLQQEKIKAYQETIEENINNTDNLEVEVTLFMGKMKDLIDELEIDSEEVEAFEKNYQIIENRVYAQKSEMDQLFENHQDQIKNMLGISLDDLKSKSPEELNQLLDDLCDRFHISKSQLFELANRFKR